MEPPPSQHSEEKSLRFSDSPRGSAQITQSLGSPARSVHPEHGGRMETIESQADLGHRTTDFFDDESSDGDHGVYDPETDTRRRSASPSKRKRMPPSGQSFVSQCEPKGPVSPVDDDGYQRLDSNLNQQIPIESADIRSESTSFNGSVDELNLLPGDPKVPQRAPKFPRPARLSSAYTGRNSGEWNHQAGFDSNQRMSTYSEKLDQRLGVHAVAYDFLLKGLLADDEVMRREQQIGQASTSGISGFRNSVLPPQLRNFDPRIPNQFDRSTSSPNKTNKKVHVVPPPIDTTSTKRTLPEDFVRTPYPFTRQKLHHKELGKEPPSALESPAGSTESILTLSVRKCNRNSRTRVTTLTIPASNAYTLGHSEKRETHFKAVAFDDEEFFIQLRQSYVSLTGSLRFFSARSLTRIVVSGPASQAADAGYGWLYQPRSPRSLAYKGLTDSFSEENILANYRKPALGRSRYAFVHWAHRLAAAPSVHTPMTGEENDPSRQLVRRIEQPEGLEFVVSWSVRRIVTALILVALLSVAAALLWIFLGKNTVLQLPGAGFRGAGDRVAAGVLIGICVFLMGMGGVAGWLGVSWLAL